MHLAQRATSMEPSATLSLDTRAKEMISRGEDVISLATGEPDFDTPTHVKQAAIDGLEAGKTKYTPSAGIVELRTAICRKLLEENNLHYAPDQVIVTAGGKQALHEVFMVICDHGDEVIIPAPYWVSYVEQVKLAGGVPVIVECGPETDYKLTAQMLKSVLNDRTRALIINSPNNPTGAVYSREELQSLASLAKQAGIYVIADEVYEYLVFDGAEHVSIAALDGMSEQVIVVNALSKSHAMTGWRLGYAAGPKPVISAMVNLQGHTTSHATSFVQHAAIVALTGDQGPRKEMVAEFDRRRKLVVERLNKMPGIKCSVPSGAFYAFPDVRSWIGKQVAGKSIGSSADLAEVLLVEGKIALVPGEAFGAGGFLRVSYALATERLIEALDRMEFQLGR